VFVKTDNPPRILRPQEPRPPFPYKSEDVVFLNKKAGIELAGTLTIPETAGPFPVVVLVSGSGPQDRNEEILGHKPFLVIADYLTRNDIAVLRYDDRGTGSSSGIYPLSTTEDFALDATAAVEYLKNRSDIDPEKIGIIGHSEGAMIAAMVAAKRKDIAFIVMMAGPGVVGEELLYMQTEAVGRSEKMPDDEIKELLDVTKHIYEIVKNEKDNEKAARQIRDYYTEISEGLSKEEKEKKGYTFVYVSATIGQVTSQWFRYFLEFDPCRDIKKVKCPVLAMNGEKDLQVPYEANLETIKTLLQKAGTAKNKTIMIEGVNHLFQTCETGLPSEYATIPETVSPKAMLSMYEWIRTVID
ncbi:MAG: alpha/beta hydrolase, partial [Bacteroidetes bacterium]|nr:alpha/beta hydrolase [Bacteroidota bacterium]